MSDGIHIPAFVVRVLALLAIVAGAKLVLSQVPEAKRYLKMESM